MKVILISGHAGSGKDTCAEILKGRLMHGGHSVLVCHYADLVKYICTAFFHWNGLKDGHGRSLLQRVGTDVVRARKPDYWVDFIIDMLTFFGGEWDYVLIPDTRFPNEVERIKEHFNAVHVRVERRNFQSHLTAEQRSHPSETALDFYPYDIRIENDGDLTALRKKIDQKILEVL